jgi:hypothetical protein
MTANIDAVYVLNKLGLEPGMSVTRALTQVGFKINETGQHAVTVANKIIKSLGGSPETNPVSADIVAKALIEQAVLSGENYNVEAANKVAQEKLTKIKLTMPYAFAATAEPVRAKKMSTRGGDKKERARIIFDRESNKTPGEIARVIAKELTITYANAYYYVSRVFK